MIFVKCTVNVQSVLEYNQPTISIAYS